MWMAAASSQIRLSAWLVCMGLHIRVSHVPEQPDLARDFRLFRAPQLHAPLDRAEQNRRLTRVRRDPDPPDELVAILCAQRYRAGVVAAVSLLLRIGNADAHDGV